MGLRNYLKSYSIIDEREKTEVKTWENYLMFACFLDVAVKVIDEFGEYYLDIVKFGRVFGFGYIFPFVWNLHSSRV